MFLERLLNTNEPLVSVAFDMQQHGVILPDTYILDLDMITCNAEAMKKEADSYGIKLYFMLKQLGRNPLVAKRIQEIGFEGVVCVDFREALTMKENGIRLGNVGHLVQTPWAAMEEIVAAHPDIMTVYSVEKAKEIGKAAVRHGFVQPIMLRVLGKDDDLYPGQCGGFPLENLDAVVKEIERIDGVHIAGVCSFPCLLYSDEAHEVMPMPNAETVKQAAQRLEELGYKDLELNMPSVSCTATIPEVAKLGGTHMEPGHGLTGTTPYHRDHDAVEGIGYVYVSEVSHSLGSKSYCYGGGHYRRSHVAGALVGISTSDMKVVHVTPPTDESIDYHFELSESCHIDDCVIMCFRTQIFVTRSEVAVVSGISTGAPKLEGIYDSQGRFLRKE